MIAIAMIGQVEDSVCIWNFSFVSHSVKYSLPACICHVNPLLRSVSVTYVITSG